MTYQHAMDEIQLALDCDAVRDCPVHAPVLRDAIEELGQLRGEKVKLEAERDDALRLVKEATSRLSEQGEELVKVQAENEQLKQRLSRRNHPARKRGLYLEDIDDAYERQMEAKLQAVQGECAVMREVVLMASEFVQMTFLGELKKKWNLPEAIISWSEADKFLQAKCTQALSLPAAKAYVQRVRKLEVIVHFLEECLKDDPNSMAWRDNHLELGDALKLLKEASDG